MSDSSRAGWAGLGARNVRREGNTTLTVFSGENRACAARKKTGFLPQREETGLARRGRNAGFCLSGRKPGLRGEEGNRVFASPGGNRACAARKKRGFLPHRGETGLARRGRSTGFGQVCQGFGQVCQGWLPPARYIYGILSAAAFTSTG